MCENAWPFGWFDRLTNLIRGLAKAQSFRADTIRSEHDTPVAIHRRLRVIVLFLVFWKCLVSKWGTRAILNEHLPRSCRHFQAISETKKAWSWMHLPSGGLDCPNTISANNSRPKRPSCLLGSLIYNHLAKRYHGKTAADVSVRLILRTRESV